MTVWMGMMLLAFNALAFTIDTAPKDVKSFKACTVTKSTNITTPPKEILPSNNLTQKPGNDNDKLAPKIILLGRVRDKDCLPIPNAEVSMWQTDEYGLRRFVTKVDTSQDLYKMNDQIYSNFEGDGSAVSNNIGDFGFVTLQPATSKKNPNATVSLVVTHPKYPELKTRVVLIDKGMSLPKTDYVIAYNDDKSKGARGLNIYAFDIVLDGKEAYLSY